MYNLAYNLENLKNDTSVHNQYWYHEIDNSSEKLLICAGDSWTWGDSLGEARTQQIYGTVLSNLTKYDFINIGLCGESNLVIVDFARQVIKNLTKTYKKIYLIFTLTESARDLNSLNFVEQNYNNVRDSSWPTFNELHNDGADTLALQKELLHTHLLDVINLHKFVKNANSIEMLLSKAEQAVIYATENNFPEYGNLNIFYAKNFCHWTGKLPKNGIKKIWTEVISEQANINKYPDNLLFLTYEMAAKRIINFQKNYKVIKNFKDELLIHLTNAEDAIKWLDDSPYNSKIATKHPLEQAHKVWAIFLYESIQF